MRRHKWFWIGGGVLALAVLIGLGFAMLRSPRLVFDGKRAYADVKKQVDFGPRTLGSVSHTQARAWIAAELSAAGWEVEVQTCADCALQPIYNIVARRGQGSEWIVLGAHYDSRFFADNDPRTENHSMAVPGANDGASGVAVLLELARTLPPEMDKEIWLVFFDAEDNGRIPGYDWIMGSTDFVRRLKDSGQGLPDKAVIVDMVGDADLNLYYERNSDEEMMKEIWVQARALGYEQFIPQYKYTILDDHLPFKEAGIPAVDIIDFDYPYWHTVSDTVDKVSSESLAAVGNTLLSWLAKD